MTSAEATYSHPAPRPFATWTICRQAGASPSGGSTALPTSWIRRSVFVKVTCSSPKAADREHDVGVLGGLRQEGVLDDDQVELPEDACCVGGSRHDAGRGDRARAHARHPSPGGRGAAPLPARPWRQGGAPQDLEGSTPGVVRHGHVARQAVGEHPHVADPLEVVMLGEGEDAGPRLPDVAGEQRQVDQRLDRFDAARLHAGRKEDGGGACAAVGHGGLFDPLGARSRKHPRPRERRTRGRPPGRPRRSCNGL